MGVKRTGEESPRKECPRPSCLWPWSPPPGTWVSGFSRCLWRRVPLADTELLTDSSWQSTCLANSTCCVQIVGQGLLIDTHRSLMLASSWQKQSPAFEMAWLAAHKTASLLATALSASSWQTGALVMPWLEISSWLSSKLPMPNDWSCLGQTLFTAAFDRWFGALYN